MARPRSRRRQNRTNTEVRQLEELPNTLIFLEEEIESIVQELGDDAFRNLPGVSAVKTKLLIKIKISKSKLYEAKVGVCEVQRKWDERGSGTRMQARFKKLMNLKMKLLKNKWNSYNRKVHDYNNSYPRNNLMEAPNFDQVKAMNLHDHF
ncbi:hypothetical protein MJO28_004028 [Puccinia striiformis f. sp. tritici]|uniref:Uncharacterized protein n=1 Tax=Puccinia striiformis f. sp. tritici TaxID=168172 RepID=A0ACC0EPW8_9BASI|nr:hypothetical protein MJO28_004028 [Puccinia striiformis f. sp. tritici]